MTKLIPVSVRLTPEDAAYLNSLKIDSAYTVSQKVRFLIGQARGQSDAKQSFEKDVVEVRKSLAPLETKLGKLSSDGSRSHLLRMLLNWTPEMTALLEVTGESVGELDSHSIEKIEGHARDMLLDLIDQMTRLSMTEDSISLDPGVATPMRKPLQQLLQLIIKEEKGEE